MTNSDYLLKAAIKKVTEKLNEIVVEKIEEASNIAQDVPEKIKKEFETLKEAIIEEATRMENEVSKSRNADNSESNQDPYLSDVLKEIEDIKVKIDHFNRKMNNTI
jgi:gas vesicle protein